MLTLVFAGTAHAAPDEIQIAQLIRTGQPHKAEALLQHSDPDKADILFFQALKAKHAGDYKRAARLLHQVLVEKPDHLNARREQAHVFMLDGRYGLAETGFETLIEIDPDPATHKLYRKFLNRINRRKPYGLSGYFSFVPSTNINRGTNNLIYDSTIGAFVIDPDSRASSGIGAEAGLYGFYRWTLDNRRRNILSWNLQGTVYENDDYNTVTANLKFNHERLLGQRTKLGFGPHYRYNWRSDDADNHGYGLNLTLLHALSPQDRLTVAATHEYRKFFDRRYNNGPLTRFSLSYEHQQSATLAYNMGLSYTVSKPRADHAIYNSTGISAGFDKAWDGGLVTGFGVNAGLRDYDNIYPLFPRPRNDSYYGISASLRHNDFTIMGFSPQTNCSYQVNKSNIAFYDYDVTECTLRIIKQF